MYQLDAGLGTSIIGQTTPIVIKLFTLYVEGGPAIGPSQELMLDTTVLEKDQAKNLILQEEQTGFINGHIMDK